MLKKKLVTIVAAVFCVALVTAQESGVFKTTLGLIEDGAIDSLKFGTEDGSGVIFGQYDNQAITLGWGNSLSDTLWLSVYDAWKYNKSFAKDTAIAKNDAMGDNAATAQPDDGINVDFTKTTRENKAGNQPDTNSQSTYSTRIANDLGVGLGINNTLGFQLVWGANYTFYKSPANITGTGAIGDTSVTVNMGNPPTPTPISNGAEITIKSEENDPGAGTNTKKEWTKYTNNNIDNNFTVNFKGVGVEDIGDIAFFVKLNKVYFNWNSINRTGDYTESSSTNGKTTTDTTITGKNTENTLTPGLNFELGLNVLSNDVATVKFVYQDDFNMTFKARTNESSKTVNTVVSDTVSLAEPKTTTDNYKVEYGKYLMWSNTFVPSLKAEFDVAEPLQLKAQLALPVIISSEVDEAGKYEHTTQTDTFVRKNGYTTYNKTTTTGAFGGTTVTVGGTKYQQNKNEFKTIFAPSLAAGFVYEVTPGKFNVNFGAMAQPQYIWKTTTLTNANINKIVKSESKDAAGNVKSEIDTANSTYGVGDNVAETKTTEFETYINTSAKLGATWFFTENVNFDVYFSTNFGGNIFDTAGASLTVKF